MAKSTLQSPILDILQLFSMIWGFISLSPHLRAPHNNMPYISHYIPQVMVSGRRTKLTRSFFLNRTLNEAIIHSSKGCTTLVTLGGKKPIIILINYKVENQMIHLDQHAQGDE